MTNSTFGVLVGSGLPGTVGVLIAFFPRVIPRTINAYWAFLGAKSRLAEEDSERLGVRITGGGFIVFAICVLVIRWSDLWQ
jgi:hypothetical protein